MSAHAERDDRHGEAILAAYSHLRSGPVLEWAYTRPEWVLAIVAFLGTLTLPYPMVAAVSAVVLALGAMVLGAVLSLREESGNCNRVIAEVTARTSEISPARSCTPALRAGDTTQDGGQ